MCENDEDILTCFGSSGGIDEGLSNVSVVHIKVATKDTPEDTFECGDAGAIDRTSNEPASTTNEMVIGIESEMCWIRTRDQIECWNSRIDSRGPRAEVKEPSCRQTKTGCQYADLVPVNITVHEYCID